MSDTQIHFEAIGRCVCLKEKISQLIEDRAALYEELNGISLLGRNVYKNPRDYKDINLVNIDRSAELLKQINDINQNIINGAEVYNLWADKAGYDHYVVNGGDNLNINVSVGFSAQALNVSADQIFIDSAITTSATIKATTEEEAEFEKHKQYVEASLDEMQSQLIGFQNALVASEQSTAQHLSGLQRQLAQLNKELEEARCKESINNMSIISLKQTMEQQEKSLAETIKRMIAGDLYRSGTLSRTL
ncbi:hypothetical protein [Providencia stuartii]|uniref:hypothetical protein n=1 Tax=Providencia stuartii TaxID=588 RepID=UPI0011207DDE|nr:hypothetical protein [Providencia stuartii]